MKKVVISGSTKLLTEAAYWKSKFEEKGYEVINYPHINGHDDEEEYKKFYADIENCDIFFLMNERKGNIEGYIGASVFGELTYAVMNNVVHKKNIKILLLDMPSIVLFCHEEIVRWIDLGWINFYRQEEL
jgi:hypothetical protein